MNMDAKPWIKVVFNCLALLSAIFAFIFFMRMDEEQSKNNQFRNHGVVSRALVTDLERDEMVRELSRGRSRTTDLYVINVRHVPKSTVKFADFPDTVTEDKLPVAPPVTGNIMEDMDFNGVMFVPKAVYSSTKVGDYLNVVATPFDTGAPALVSEVQSFEASDYYPRIAIAVALAVAFFSIGLLFGKSANMRLVGAIARQASTL